MTVSCPAARHPTITARASLHLSNLTIVHHGSGVRSDVDFATNSNYTFFLYQLVDFIDPTHNGATSSIDALNYSNNPFSDCTVHSLSLSAYLNPVALELESPVTAALSIPLTARQSSAATPVLTSTCFSKQRQMLQLSVIFLVFKAAFKDISIATDLGRSAFRMHHF